MIHILGLIKFKQEAILPTIMGGCMLNFNKLNHLLIHKIRGQHLHAPRASHLHLGLRPRPPPALPQSPPMHLQHCIMNRPLIIVEHDNNGK